MTTTLWRDHTCSRCSSALPIRPAETVVYNLQRGPNRYGVFPCRCGVRNRREPKRAHGYAR